MAVITIDTDAGPVDCKTKWDDFSKGFSMQGPWVKMDYVVDDWAMTDPVLRAIAGVGTVRPPHLCPVAFGLRAVDTSCVGVGEKDSTDGKPNYEVGIITATYGITQVDFDGPEQPPGDPDMYFPNEIAPGEPYLYMEHSIKFSKEIIRIPAQCLKYYGDGKPCPSPVTRSVAVADFTVTRYFADKLPYLNFTDYMDTLNHATFFGQERGTMKFVNGETRKVFKSDGTGSQQIDLHFQWRRAGHNRVYRPDVMKFEHVVDNVGDFLYPHRDLRNLIADIVPTQAPATDIFGQVSG